MKKLTANKAYLVFYAFDIVLLIVVAVFLLPFSKNNNSPNSKNAAFIEAEQLKDITEIRILNKNAKCRVSMHRIGGQWMGTDSFSNDSLYWPADNKTVENFLVQMSTEIPWTKKAAVNIGLPECGQLGLQVCQFRISQKHILILPIGAGAGNRFTLYTLISNI